MYNNFLVFWRVSEYVWSWGGGLVEWRQSRGPANARVPDFGCFSTSSCARPTQTQTVMRLKASNEGKSFLAFCSRLENDWARVWGRIDWCQSRGSAKARVHRFVCFSTNSCALLKQIQATVLLKAINKGKSFLVFCWVLEHAWASVGGAGQRTSEPRVI